MGEGRHGRLGAPAPGLELRLATSDRNPSRPSSRGDYHPPMPDPAPRSRDLDAWMVEQYAGLRRMAQAFMSRQRDGLSFQATEVVSEVFLRLRSAFPGEHRFVDRSHFLAAFCRHMRWWVVTHIKKSQGRRRTEVRWLLAAKEDDEELRTDMAARLVDLNTALDELAAVDSTMATVVDLRVIGGLTHAQVGEVLGISKEVAKDKWLAAVAVLRERLTSLDQDE